MYTIFNFQKKVHPLYHWVWFRESSFKPWFGFVLMAFIDNLYSHQSNESIGGVLDRCDNARQGDFVSQFANHKTMLHISPSKLSSVLTGIFYKFSDKNHNIYGQDDPPPMPWPRTHPKREWETLLHSFFFGVGLSFLQEAERRWRHLGPKRWWMSIPMKQTDPENESWTSTQTLNWNMETGTWGG